MKTNVFSTLFMLGLIASLAISCKDDPPPPVPVTTTGVLIANAGLEVNGTGSISMYDPKQKTIQHNLFYKNNTYPPGTLLNSILIEGDRTFLVMNGLGTIRVLNSDNFELQKNITGMVGPRYMMKVGAGKYYVTDWGAQGVWVVHINSNKTPSYITTGLAPEHMAQYGNLVFVANSGGAFSDSTLTIINAEEDAVVATIKVGHNPHSLQIDKNDVLWVLCSGIEDAQNPFNSTQGSLVSFDLTRDSLEFYVTDSLVVRDSLVFTDNQIKPTKLTLNADGSMLYFLDNDLEANLWRHNVADTLLPSSPFIQGSFNSLGYDAIEEEIYLSDPGDKTTEGQVYRYDEGGGQVDLFEVGTNPVNFGFK